MMDPLPNVKQDKIKLVEINEYITCKLCKGYFIDATTISECLHSFCRSCIIRFLQENSHCPICEMIINKAKPNIKLDKTLQDIVYKLVPELFINEMARRQRFYESRPEEKAKTTPEERGVDTERTIFNPRDAISLSIEYISDDSTPGAISVPETKYNPCQNESQMKRFLQCPGNCRIEVLKKFVQNKYSVDVASFHIEILYKRVPLPNHYTLIDIAYIYSWKRNEPMKFFFRILDKVLIEKAANCINSEYIFVKPPKCCKKKHNEENNSNRKNVSESTNNDRKSPKIDGDENFYQRVCKKKLPQIDNVNNDKNKLIIFDDISKIVETTLKIGDDALKFDKKEFILSDDISIIRKTKKNSRSFKKFDVEENFYVKTDLVKKNVEKTKENGVNEEFSGENDEGGRRQSLCSVGGFCSKILGSRANLGENEAESNRKVSGDDSSEVKVSGSDVGSDEKLYQNDSKLSQNGKLCKGENEVGNDLKVVGNDEVVQDAVRVSEGDSKGSQNDLKVSQNDLKVSQNDSKGCQNDFNGSQNDSNGSLNDSKVSRDDSKVDQIDSKVEVDSKVSQNDSNGSQNDSKVSQNDSKVIQNGSKVEVDSKLSQNDSKVSQNDCKVVQVDSKLCQNVPKVEIDSKLDVKIDHYDFEIEEMREKNDLGCYKSKKSKVDEKSEFFKSIELKQIDLVKKVDEKISKGEEEVQKVAQKRKNPSPLKNESGLPIKRVKRKTSPPQKIILPPQSPPKKANDDLKEIFSHCKFNIPSSLSITLKETSLEDDGRNNLKLEPVKNFIEILKIPEQKDLLKNSNQNDLNQKDLNQKNSSQKEFKSKSAPNLCSKPIFAPLKRSPCELNSVSKKGRFDFEKFQSSNLMKFEQNVAKLHSASLNLNYTVSVNQNVMRHFGKLDPKFESFKIKKIKSPVKNENEKKIDVLIKEEKEQIVQISRHKVEIVKKSPKNSSPVSMKKPQTMVPILPKPSSINLLDANIQNSQNVQNVHQNVHQNVQNLVQNLTQNGTNLTTNQLMEKYNIQNLAQLTASLHFNPMLNVNPSPVVLQQAILKQFELQNRQNWQLSQFQTNNKYLSANLNTNRIVTKEN